MLLNIQALRAIAALLVVLVHLQVLGAPLGLGRGLFDLFAVGVDLFFVVSGFIMVHTTARRPVTPGGFILDRFLRIAPLYWLLTLAVFVVASATPALLGTTRADWGALARSLAFIPYAREDGTMRPILFVGWSLNLEMAFYMVFALALPAGAVSRRVAFGVGLLTLAVVAGLALKPVLSAEMRFLTQPVILEFAAGMVIGWLYPRLPASRALACMAACTGGMALAALLLTARWPLPGGWPVSLPAAFIVVLCALTAERGGLAIIWRPARLLGDASYALYLVHPFATQAWTIAAIKAGLISPAAAPVLMLSALASSIALGLATHVWLEKPLAWVARAIPARLARIGARAKADAPAGIAP